MTEPREVLSAWRVAAVPRDAAEKTVHQAILRSFARTGSPPPSEELDGVVTGSGRTAREVLAALHECDAIRLTPGGRVAVAYPFSGTPTRHRVRIDEAVDVYAMCAIDALGISPMLGQDTRIESVDVTSGRPITITTTGGRTTWDPDSAVVFVGADAGGGPSAHCCCDYLNFHRRDRRPGMDGRSLTHPGPDPHSTPSRSSRRAPLRSTARMTAPPHTPREETDDMTVTNEAQHLVALIREQFGLPDLPLHLGRLLAAGEPVTVAAAAAAGGWTEQDLRDELSRHPGTPARTGTPRAASWGSG